MRIWSQIRILYKNHNWKCALSSSSLRFPIFNSRIDCPGLIRVLYIITKNIYISLPLSLWCSLCYISQLLIFEKIFATKSAGIIFMLCKKWDNLILLLLTNLKYVSYYGGKYVGLARICFVLKIINSSLII